MHHSMLINAVNHTYPNYYSHLADVLFCLTGIFTYQTDALPSRPSQRRQGLFSPRATDSQDALNLSELHKQGNDHHENAFRGVHEKDLYY